MFVAGLGAAQFALPAAVDMLRSLRMEPPRQPEMVITCRHDPANPMARCCRGRAGEECAVRLLTAHGPQSGASVVLRQRRTGGAYLRRRNPALRVFLPER